MSNRTILIIEDNSAIRENIAELLQLGGYTTLTAPQGKKGVELALAHKPDLIICDIMMPELDGYGVLHLLRSNPETEHIPLVYLSAKSDRSDLRKGMDLGADDYITKPFQEIELMNAIESRLKRSSIAKKQYDSNSQGLQELTKDLQLTGQFTLDLSAYERVPLLRKQLLYQEGKTPRFLYHLVSGKIKGIRVHEDGKEYITDLYSEGDYIGYPAIIEDGLYEDSAIALVDSELIRIPRDEFQSILEKDMQVTHQFIRIISRNMKEKEERLLNLAYSSLRKRIAKALMDIHDKFPKTGEANTIGITRDDIARYVGTATESLIRTLSDFKSEKLIEVVDGKINILAPEKLRNLLY
jgi:DNA-binding response OmpR family regulator